VVPPEWVASLPCPDSWAARPATHPVDMEMTADIHVRASAHDTWQLIGVRYGQIASWLGQR